MTSDEMFSPGLEGVIATDTKLSFLDVEHERIVVRGYDLIELARRVHYTDVAFLLIHGALPGPGKQSMFANALGDGAALPDGMRELLRSLPPGTHPMDTLRTGISALAGSEDPDRLDDTGHGANVTKGVRIVAAAPTIVAEGYRAAHDMPSAEPEHDLSHPARFLRMIPGAATDDDAVAIFDRVLTCYAEHELANSTLAARVVASSLGDIYGALTGATAALKGPLHGGANEEAARMFAAIHEHAGDPADAAEGYVVARLEAGERVMGFGHRVYMHRADPRAVLLHDDLLALAERRADAEAYVAAYERAVEVMQREKGLYPNADLPIGLILYLLDIPIELFTPIFLCARAAGLVAHVIEQHDHNRIYRPRVLYEGPFDLHPRDDFRPAPL
jgi:citrate synthase